MTDLIEFRYTDRKGRTSNRSAIIKAVFPDYIHAFDLGKENWRNIRVSGMKDIILMKLPKVKRVKIK